MQRHWPHVDMDQTYLSNPIEICGKCEYNHIMIDLKRLKDDRRAQKAGYSERVKAIRNVQSYVDLACQTQAAAIRRPKNIIIDKSKPLVDKRLWQGQ